MEKEEFVCVICGKEFEGYGNNPEPVKSSDEGKCCDDCNMLYVIPARIEESKK